MDGKRFGDSVKDTPTVGFMQGRLVPMINGKIQAFPVDNWLEELELAHQHGFDIMEWTLDFDRLYENPLLSSAGQSTIRAVQTRTGLSIPSLTGDCFMQAPFWKSSNRKYIDDRLKELSDILDACASIGCGIVVVPLVDNGRPDRSSQERLLTSELMKFECRLFQLGIRLCFETDLDPESNARWIDKFNSDRFGINYDIGNSASLGHDPDTEVPVLGGRIINVHVKDRMLRGTTVPLGQGAANIPRSIELLHQNGYISNLVLQTARAPFGRDVEVLLSYRNWVRDLISKYWGTDGSAA